MEFVGVRGGREQLLGLDAEDDCAEVRGARRVKRGRRGRRRDAAMAGRGDILRSPVVLWEMRGVKSQGEANRELSKGKREKQEEEPHEGKRLCIYRVG